MSERNGNHIISEEEYRRSVGHLEVGFRFRKKKVIIVKNKSLFLFAKALPSI